MFDDELDASFSHIIDEWRLAEERIKSAEFVREGEVVASAIFELRYAGRKLVQVIATAFGPNGIGAGSSERTAALVTLAEARECCIKAKHDALDSIITFLTLYFRDTRTKLNIRLIQKYFPSFLEDVSKIRAVQAKIAVSRSENASSRDEIYEDIYQNDYPALLNLYERISASANLVDEEIKSDRRSRRREIAFNIITFLFGLFGALDLADKYHVVAHGKELYHWILVKL